MTGNANIGDANFKPVGCIWFDVCLAGGRKREEIQVATFVRGLKGVDLGHTFYTVPRPSELYKVAEFNRSDFSITEFHATSPDGVKVSFSRV